MRTNNDKTHRPEPIELTAEEKVLLRKVAVLMDASMFGPDPPYEERLASLVAAHDLTLALARRKAIPKARRDYFTDPQHNVGTKMSRMEVFERNGTVGEDIFRHPHFLKYLRYFIFGPDLPQPVIEGFCELADDWLSDEIEIGRYARKMAREYGMNKNLDTKHHAVEEFHKLAIECGVRFPMMVRDAVMQLRTQ